MSLEALVPRACCSRCGVVAPQTGARCASCDALLGRVTTGATPPDEPFWVAVRCSFQCRSCSFAAPLDMIETRGSVECAHCGVRQRFDTDGWKDALAFAQSVGDLAGPDPEGRAAHPRYWIGNDNPFRRVGVDSTFAEHSQVGIHRVEGLELWRSLRIEAAPGRPTCQRCRAEPSAPLTVTVRPDGQTDARCPACGDTATYALPEAARTLAPTLVAVLADEHRTDRPRAHETTVGAGVQALACPSCGGPLHLESHTRIASCEFCKATCLIPARAMRSAGAGREPKPALWWQLFRGPSTKRADLEKGSDAPIAIGAAAALMLVGPSRIRVPPVGEQPGLYEAPPVSGPNFPQILFTLVLGSIALLVGYLVTAR